MNDELSNIYVNVRTAKRPEDVFGELAGRSQADMEKEISERYRNMIKIAHPDMNSSDAKSTYFSEEATKLLNQYYKEARELVSSGSYGKPSHASPGNNSTVFNAGDYEYRIFEESVEGDFCTAYFGERVGKSGIEKICLKVAGDYMDNDMLDNEASILKKISHKSMPVFLGSFTTDGRKRANVLKRIENSHDFHSIREEFPGGLPQEHGAWIMDRLLSVLGYLHTNNLIHGNIEPSNILVTPHDHNSFLIDYLLAIPEANECGAEYSGINEYSAPEIEKNAKPHPSADMYSLGKTMVYLLGGKDVEIPDTIDERIQEYLSGFLKEDPDERKNDAWTAWHELSGLRKDVFGADHQFLPLEMKKR